MRVQRAFWGWLKAVHHDRRSDIDTIAAAFGVCTDGRTLLQGLASHWVELGVEQGVDCRVGVVLSVGYVDMVGADDRGRPCCVCVEWPKRPIDDAQWLRAARAVLATERLAVITALDGGIRWWIDPPAR